MCTEWAAWIWGRLDLDVLGAVVVLAVLEEAVAAVAARVVPRLVLQPGAG